MDKKIVKCKSCGKNFFALNSEINRGNAKYCSLKCVHDYAPWKKEKFPDTKCSFCGKIFHKPKRTRHNSKSGLFFCSRECKDKAQKMGGIKEIMPDHYGTGITTYRTKAINYYGSKCQECGYDEDQRMLDVDHIDGNRSNAKVGNLKVLCVWCHALKTRGVKPHRRRGIGVMGTHNPCKVESGVRIPYPPLK